MAVTESTQVQDSSSEVRRTQDNDVAAQSSPEQWTEAMRTEQRRIGNDPLVTQHLPSLEIVGESESKAPGTTSAKSSLSPQSRAGDNGEAKSSNKQSQGEPDKEGVADRIKQLTSRVKDAVGSAASSAYDYLVGDAGTSKDGENGWRPSAEPNTADLSLMGMTRYFENLARNEGLDENQAHAFRHIAAAAYFTQKYGPAAALALGDPKKLADLSLGGLDSAYQISRGAAQSVCGRDSSPLKEALRNSGSLMSDLSRDAYNDVHNNHAGIKAGLEGRLQGKSWQQIERDILSAVRTIRPNQEHNHHYMPEIDWRMDLNSRGNRA
jgi:hypothetical protein